MNQASSEKQCGDASNNGGGEGASNWVKFINTEIQRKQQLAGG